MITRAIRRPLAFCSRWRIAEVLPAPRKPVITVAGIFPAEFLGATAMAYLYFCPVREGEPEAAPDQGLEGLIGGRLRHLGIRGPAGRPGCPGSDGFRPAGESLRCAPDP